LGAWIEQAKVGVGVGDETECVVQGNTVGGSVGKCSAEDTDQRGQALEMQTFGASSQTTTVAAHNPQPGAQSVQVLGPGRRQRPGGARREVGRIRHGANLRRGSDTRRMTPRPPPQCPRRCPSTVRPRQSAPPSRCPPERTAPPAGASAFAICFRNSGSESLDGKRILSPGVGSARRGVRGGGACPPDEACEAAGTTAVPLVHDALCIRWTPDGGAA